MRVLRVIEHITLDGVVQHFADGDGFPYGGWTGPYRSPEGAELVTAAHGESFDLLLGRRTYDEWSGFWPQAPSSPMTDRLNAATKHVVTHRRDGLGWGPVTSLGPDLVADVRKLKSEDGPDLVVSGSSTLTSVLLGHGLADEVWLIVYPVLLGTGKPFFAAGTPPRSFELTGTEATPAGVVLSSYAIAGPLSTA